MMEALKIKWLLFAISGLILLGAGLSMAIDAALYRMNNSESLNWIFYGTAALLVFNSGICLFGQGVIFRIRMDNLREA
jgi:uncharacterized membrane protein (UPF0136 family)